MDHLPPELWQIVVTFLDIPDAQALSYTNRYLFSVVTDPACTHARLRRTASFLSDAVVPGAEARLHKVHELHRRRILLTPFQLAPESRPQSVAMLAALSLRMKMDMLRRQLAVRPSRHELEQRGVVCQGSSCSTVLAGKAKDLERQQVCDVIAQFYQSEQRPNLENAIKRGIVAERRETQRPVRTLTRMFSYWNKHGSRDNVAGRTTTTAGEPAAPARANVYKMRQRFEKTLCDSEHPFVVHQPLSKQRTGVHYGAVAVLRQRFLQLTA